MKKIPLADTEPNRVRGEPDESSVVFEGSLSLEGHTIRRIELKRYVEQTDELLGEYSLLTVQVETDRGNIEMKYDEGFRGNDALQSATRVLTQYAGLSSLINRAILELHSSDES